MDEQQTTTVEPTTVNTTIPILGKRIPDYTGDRYCARELAKLIETYYHKKGYKHVKVWAEANETGPKVWGVRSNILFSVPILS